MSYAQLPAGDLKDPVETSWDGSLPRCLAFTVIAACFCILGNQGVLGEIGTPCPAGHWGPDYASQFLGGGGEGYLREYLGELGILFFYFADALAMMIHARGRLIASAVIVIVLLLFTGQIEHMKFVVVLCCGALLIITVGNSILGKIAGMSRDSHVLRRIAISGGLVVLIARQTVGPEAVSPFWFVMFGRLLLLIPIVQGALTMGRSGFQEVLTRLGFPAPASIGLLAFVACILGCMMNVVGATLSFLMCDLTFTVHVFGYRFWVIVVQGIALPGAELLIVSLLAYTAAGHFWPFLVGPTADRMHHWQEMIENGAVIGGLTYMTGSDVWSL